ncbi:SigE family RNA polymerase sigma factor [Nonomuraea phyllanthi]|uniref:hypothetical protein n=1 Tax=Nonomuraea phyllanthi TaxID=2219224 RepID=UPI001D034799|nr:hypothetical protein [Nonomuraea phyllanthi]
MHPDQQRDFADFVAARSDSLIRLAYVLTNDQHAAEDLLQSALAKTAGRWRRIRGTLVGSAKGFVLCAPTKELPEPPVFTYWGNKVPGDVAGFPGKLSVDIYTTHYWYRENPPPHDNYVRIVAGRVALDVRRVTIAWSPGERTDAVVSNGFFIARTPAKTVSRKSRNSGEPERFVDTPPVTVTAYDAAGRIAGRYESVRFGWRGPGSLG